MLNRAMWVTLVCFRVGLLTVERGGGVISVSNVNWSLQHR